MAKDGDMPCWEITQCGRTEECIVCKEPGKECWELASKLNDYRSNLNVCSDCIVFLAKQKDSALPAEEIQSILEKKGVCVLVASCPLSLKSSPE